MAYFRETRNIELSVVYYLETEIASNWSGVTVVKSFTNSYSVDLPVVCVRLVSADNDHSEIGSTSLLNDYHITVDVFAKSDGQRNDLADFIKDTLKEGCPYYEHSQNGESLTRVENGRIHLLRFVSNQRLDFGDNVDTYDRFRHLIEVIMRKD